VQIIRKANLSDAALLSRLAERSFRETFDFATTRQDMDLHCRDSYSEAIQAREISSQNMVTLVAEQGEDLVGLAQVAWSQAPSFVQGASPGEIKRLYIASHWHGKGVAQALMSASLDELKARGSDVAWLGVWKHNARAIAFYQKFGFIECGEHVFYLGHDPQTDIVMTRSV
jgi:ribosomal protein S18 acetylase RimI-like enzyme